MAKKSFLGTYSPQKVKSSTMGDYHPHVDVHFPKVPTHREKEKDLARSEKLNATREWIAGHMSTAKHAAVHHRANRVIRNKHIKY